MAASLVNQTYDRLLSMIVKREYKPGDRLPSEMVLCEELEVSRNTLRAALNKLSALGITETRHGGGTYVKEVGSDVYLNFLIPAVLTHNLDLLEIMRFRKGIEVESARQAAEMATEEHIEKLRELLERCREYGDVCDFARFEIEDANFHGMIAEASGNAMFIKIMEIIRMLLNPEMQNFLRFQGTVIDSNYYHEMILQCIIHRKPDDAAYFMQRHMTAIVERVKHYVTTN